MLLWCSGKHTHTYLFPTSFHPSVSLFLTRLGLGEGVTPVAMATFLFELPATANTGDVVVIVVMASVVVLVIEFDDCLACSEDLFPRLLDRLLELVVAVVVALTVAVLVADICIIIICTAY